MQHGSSEYNRLLGMCIHEQRLRELGFVHIAGVDEAGRGPLAGPVVAAACILPNGLFFEFLNDSKKLSYALREKLYFQIIAHPEVVWGVGMSNEALIDELNILQATFLAMQQAVALLVRKPDYLLVDGNCVWPQCEIPAQAIVRGDAQSVSIAAASIIAKYTRDQWMEKQEDIYPGYGFKKHKGYGTKDHFEAIRCLGPCPIHRKSFEPINIIKRKL